MSVLQILSSLPCINSRKIARTLILELEGRGYHIVLYKRPVDPEWQPLTHETVEERNVPEIHPFEDDGS